MFPSKEDGYNGMERREKSEEMSHRVLITRDIQEVGELFYHRF